MSETHLRAHSLSPHFTRLVPQMDAISETTAIKKGRDAVKTADSLSGQRRGPPGATYLVIQKYVSPENVSKWLEMAEELATATRSEEGCIFYDFVSIANEPTSFIIVECWASTAHLAGHAATPHFTRLVPAMDAISKTLLFVKGTDALSGTAPMSPAVPSCKPRVGKLLVMYDSSTGCTRQMAALVREGALQLNRTEVRLRKIGGPTNSWDAPEQVN